MVGLRHSNPIASGIEIFQSDWVMEPANPIGLIFLSIGLENSNPIRLWNRFLVLEPDSDRDDGFELDACPLSFSPPSSPEAAGLCPSDSPCSRASYYNKMILA